MLCGPVGAENLDEPGRGRYQATDDHENFVKNGLFGLFCDHIIPNDYKVLRHGVLLLGDRTYFRLDDS